MSQSATDSDLSTRRLFLAICMGAVVSGGALLTGCHRFRRQTSNSSTTPPPVRSFKDPQALHSGQVRRLVILPFENRTRNSRAAELLREQLVQQIQGCGIFEVVDVSRFYDPSCSPEPITRGQYPFELLAELYRRFNADAVMFGSINQQSSYWPLSLGATIHLVDTRDALVLSTVDGDWSVADEQTYQDYDEFLQNLRDHPAAQDPRLLHSSPKFFSSYVARLIVSAWK